MAKTATMDHCKCGNEMPPERTCRRDCTGRKLATPVCTDCYERSVRESILRRPRMFRATAEVRR